MGTCVESLLWVTESAKLRLQLFQFQSRHVIHVVPSLGVMIRSKLRTQNCSFLNLNLKELSW